MRRRRRLPAPRDRVVATSCPCGSRAPPTRPRRSTRRGALRERRAFGSRGKAASTAFGREPRASSLHGVAVRDAEERDGGRHGGGGAGRSRNRPTRICNPVHNRFATAPLSGEKGKPRLPFFESGAGEESRTLDLNLGKVALYQLSYSRIARRPRGASGGRQYSRPRRLRRQCVVMPSVGFATSAGAAAAASAGLAGSSSGSGCGAVSSASSSTRSIHFTGTISSWFLTFSGMS